MTALVTWFGLRASTLMLAQAAHGDHQFASKIIQIGRPDILLHIWVCQMNADLGHDPLRPCDREQQYGLPLREQSLVLPKGANTIESTSL